MLVRVAESIYWMARYLERAENTARLIKVNTNLVLDLPAGFAPGWDCCWWTSGGGRDVFDALDGRAEDANSERRVVRFLIAERQQRRVDRLVAAHGARERAHAARGAAGEVSELLNEFFAEFTRDLANGLNERTRFDFLKQTVLRRPDPRRAARRHDEPQRRLHLPADRPQPRARRHDQPHRRRTLGAAAAGRHAGRRPSSTRCSG